MIKKICVYFLVFVMTFMAFPIPNVEAKTLRNLKSELNELERKYNETRAAINQTRGQIRNTENNIVNSKREIDRNRTAIDEAIVKIEALSIEIAKTEEHIKQLIDVFQIANGENAYLDYILNSTSYAEYVFRYSMIREIADFNNSKVESFNNQIEENKQLQIDLAERQKELDRLIEVYQNNLISLDRRFSKIAEEELSVSAEIAMA